MEKWLVAAETKRQHAPAWKLLIRSCDRLEHQSRTQSDKTMRFLHKYHVETPMAR